MWHKESKDVVGHQVLALLAARGMKNMWKEAQASLLEDERP